MLIVQQPSTDPYFNIATEEYLLNSLTDDFFILYLNQPSIIVGKHQNTSAEINHDFVKQRSLKVVRRLSGGGTVYHDLGNLNYTFIANGSEGNLVDFKKHTRPILEVLNTLGVDAIIGGKNDIRVGSKKVSGNAEHVYKNRVLHHGTLLFSSNLDDLNEAIRVDAGSYSDKAVKSIRSQVANISEYLKGEITIEGFVELIENHVKKTFPNSADYSLSSEDISSINNLIRTKYSTWEWNFGYSPIYTLNRRIEVDSKQISIELTVEKGAITKVSVSGVINKSKATEIEQLLIGCKHDYESISKLISKADLGILADKILSGLF